jgi:dTDP-4-amino-4,6-dideoxygalactose transaminase
MMVGARPVFADIDPVRLTIDPQATAAAVTTRTAAIVPVHLYGQAADMDGIAAIAARHGLAVIEDCCQAHLATCGGRPVGSFGLAAAYSFYPTKNLGALGDGGALTTNDDRVAARARRLRNGGQTDRYHHAEFGVNSRLDEMQAAVLYERLRGLNEMTRLRRALAGQYRTGLDGADSVLVPPEQDDGHVYHLFPVLAENRDVLQRHLKQQGVETLVHYPVPIPRQAALAREQPADCPVATRVCDRVLSLPLYPALGSEAIDQIVAAVRSFPMASVSLPRT